MIDLRYNSQTARHSQRGMALVLTLSTVVLLTVLVLAFFSRAQLNRQISFSSTNLFKADALSRSALDIIVGELRAEITDTTRSTSSSSSGLTLYQPINKVDWLPQPLGVAGATGPLVKVSGNGIPIRAGGTITGSSISINTASINGRSLSSARWYTSSTSSPKLGTGPLPTWLFMTRSNGVKTPGIATAKDPTQNDYVIGRFAYTIYDTGELFDATVAGYPTSSPFITPSTDIGFKASTSYVDLSLFGFSTTNLDRFISWRNAITGADAATYLEWAAGITRTSGIGNYAALAAARSGHRSIVMGDNTPLTRRDLLSHPNLTASTCTLSHFSRSLNSPAFAPATVTTTNSNLGTLRFPASYSSVIHYRDDGTTETYAVLAGDLQLQRRFSLAKLAWLGPNGPNATAFNATLTSAQRDEAIRSCFGLEWTNDRWKYTAGTSASVIKTLTEVANENREPNFFEMLKAGILDGSVGKAATNRTTAGDPQRGYEAQKDLQILRIGANIIDCADSDNYPTCLTLKNLTVYGVEDLPYLYGLHLGRISVADNNSTVKTATVSACTLVVVPTLFNPHAKSSPSATPSDIRIRILNGVLQSVYSSYNATTLAATGVPRNLADPTTAIVIPYNSTTTADTFRNTFGPVLGSLASSNTRLNTLAPNAQSNQKEMHGFKMYEYSSELPQTYDRSLPANLVATVDSLMIVLEYSSGGQWHIYDTMVGNDQDYSSGISGKQSAARPFTMAFPPNIGNKDATTGEYKGSPDWRAVVGALLKFDPRTTRFGLGFGSNFQPLVCSPPLPAPANTLLAFGLDSALPFGSGAVNYVYPGSWAEGGTTSWNDANGSAINNVSDPDGTTRPADAGLNGANANLFRNMSDATRRPVILQRPFRTVTELGQVFRDSPWKSLNFFDPSSGDKGLLDLFSVADEPTVIVGRVNLNTTQTRVHQAIFTGAAQAPDGTSPLANPNALATAYANYAFSGGIPTTAMPVTVSNAVDFMSTASLPIGGGNGLDAIKYRREAVIRSLSNTTQTRTWNLLIDVVAQAGHYSANAGSLDNFIVEGERRYWLSVAIDRLTGKVIDQQLEPAND